MELKDLTHQDRFFLALCKDKPDFQYDGPDRTVMNILAAYGLVRYAGNSKFEISEEGEDILMELNSQETSEEIPSHLQ